MLTIILAVLLIAGYFLAWYAGFSGFDMVKMKGGDWNKYITLIFPLVGLLLLIGAANNGNYPLGRNLLAWLPLLAVIWLFLLQPVLMDKQSFSAVLKSLGKGWGVGLWITIVTSFILAFYNPRK